MSKSSVEEYKAHAVGCFLGACVGDAAGAPLEMLGRAPKKSEVEKALRMAGGGVHRVIAGQITDDSELALAMAHALVEGGSHFNVDLLARQRAFSACSRMDLHRPGLNWANKMSSAASTTSKANGSLMRCTPLSVWGCRLSADVLGSYAASDASLSHNNSTVRDAEACYVVACAHLIRSGGDRNGAFAIAEDWACDNANEEVRSWLTDARSGTLIPFWPQAGFVKVGFVHAFRHLAQGSSYFDAVRETIVGGGDTDTNAAIVGGMIGAACGASEIPDAMKEVVLNCVPTREDALHARPEWLHSCLVPGLVEKLLEVGPQ